MLARIPASMAPSPHNAPLHERPSIASRESEPGPVNATVKAATDRANVYSKPPLVMKRASGWSYAIVPIVGPLIGGGLAGLLLHAVIK
jgi:hypothetical protein